jgi:hypothetical protein
MKNSKAWFLLWTVLFIALLPVLSRLFTPGVPGLMIWVGLMIAVSCTVAIMSKADSNQGNNKTSIWLRSVWLVALVIFILEILIQQLSLCG